MSARISFIYKSPIFLLCAIYCPYYKKKPEFYQRGPPYVVFVICLKYIPVDVILELFFSTVLANGPPGHIILCIVLMFSNTEKINFTRLRSQENIANYYLPYTDSLTGVLAPCY